MRELEALIVDDEPIARKGLRILLQRIPDVAVVGEAGDLETARLLIADLQPAVVFLDIGLRGGESGLDLTSGLSQSSRPAIVYVTAYSEHAVRAFDQEAVDYLLKPVAPERLVTAIARVRKWMTISQSNSRVSFRVDGSTRFIQQHEIESVEAAGNYCCVQAIEGQFVVRETLTAITARLQAGLFVRVHRSLLVATNAVVEIQALANRDALLLLRSGRRVKVSRQFRHSVQTALQGQLAMRG